MTTVFKIGAIVVGVSLVSACGGTTTEFNPPSTSPGPFPAQTDVQRFNSLTDDFTDRLDRVSAMNVSSASAMNRASGTATFTGEAGVLVDPSFIGTTVVSVGTTLVGEANVDVNFNQNTFDGAITDIVGGDRSNNADSYGGTIHIRQGVIGGTSPEALSGIYSGSLYGNGDVVVVRGAISGEFTGNPDVRALTLIGDGNTGTVNGIGNGSVLVVAADRN